MKNKFLNKVVHKVRYNYGLLKSCHKYITTEHKEYLKTISEIERCVGILRSEYKSLYVKHDRLERRVKVLEQAKPYNGPIVSTDVFCVKCGKFMFNSSTPGEIDFNKEYVCDACVNKEKYDRA